MQIRKKILTFSLIFSILTTALPKRSEAIVTGAILTGGAGAFTALFFGADFAAVGLMILGIGAHDHITDSPRKLNEGGFILALFLLTIGATLDQIPENIQNNTPILDHLTILHDLENHGYSPSERDLILADYQKLIQVAETKQQMIRIQLEHKLSSSERIKKIAQEIQVSELTVQYLMAKSGNQMTE